MLNSIYVNNFKSLVNFDLEIRDGLNILVGPNGSGKSNVLLFFEFLSYLTTESVSSAISYIGGAGEIFRRQSNDDQYRNIKFCLKGEARNNYTALGQPVRRIKYEYEAIVSLNERRDRIYFSHQSLKASVSNRNNEYTRLKSGTEKHDIYATFDASDDGSNGQLLVRSIDQRKIRLPGPIVENEDGTRVKTYIDDAAFLQQTIISELYRIIPEFTSIQSDLDRGRTFNIDPQVARHSSELTRQPGLAANGDGLAATLYHLKNPPTKRRIRFRTRTSPEFFHRKNAFDQVIEYIKAINPDILNLDIDANQLENYVRILLRVRSGNDSVLLPLKLASDGTVKWVAIVTALLTNRSIFAIEEPENFLHPHMQAEIVRIMRESSSFGVSGNKFVVMTTHSETLLNAVDPSEIIVVTMSDGITNVTRPSNIEELRDLISDTGFGVGHLYITNGLIS